MMISKNTSTRFSHEHEVGAKCSMTRIVRPATG
jgi:hypothetical protein